MELRYPSVIRKLVGRPGLRDTRELTLNAANLGFAQGSSSITPNLISAHVGGVLKATTQPAALGPAGLGIISDAEIPTLSFPFHADGSNGVHISLTSSIN